MRKLIKKLHQRLIRRGKLLNRSLLHSGIELEILGGGIIGYYCDTWNPTDAGDYLNKAYRSINPTDEKPLVMVLEECDGILMDILENRIKPHKEIPIQIRKKMDWNKMLDKINYGLYPNLILILTSNVHLEEINKKDGSLLRENRIHGAFHMTRKMLNESIKSKSE